MAQVSKVCILNCSFPPDSWPVESLLNEGTRPNLFGIRRGVKHVSVVDQVPIQIATIIQFLTPLNPFLDNWQLKD